MAPGMRQKEFLKEFGHILQMCLTTLTILMTGKSLAASLILVCLFWHYSPRSTCGLPSEHWELNGHKYDQLRNNRTNKRKVLSFNSFFPMDSQAAWSAASLGPAHNPSSVSFWSSGRKGRSLSADKQTHPKKLCMLTAPAEGRTLVITAFHDFSSDFHPKANLNLQPKAYWLD